MVDTFRDGKVHVMAEKCAQCLLSPQRIVPGQRAASIVKETTSQLGGHFICHRATISGEGDAICRAWFDRFGDDDPIIRLAKSMDIIEEQKDSDHADG